MSASKGYTPPSRAELQAMREAKSQTVQSEADRREKSFLRNVAGAGDDLEWILLNQAWTQLGYERVGDWWERRVLPVLVKLDLRPSEALAKQVMAAIESDEAALPKVQRRTQREIATLARTSQAKVSRSLTKSRESGSDLEEAPPGNSHDTSGGTGGVPTGGQNSPETQPSTGLISGAPAGQPLVPDASGDIESTATGRPGIEPPTAMGEAPASEHALAAGVTPSGLAGPGEAVEGGASTPPDVPSSTDPASEWMDVWRVFIGALEALDVDAVSPMLTDAERAEMDADYPYIGKRLTALGVWQDP